MQKVKNTTKTNHKTLKKPNLKTITPIFYRGIVKNNKKQKTQ